MSDEQESSYLTTIVELNNLVRSMNGRRPLIGDVQMCQECDRLYVSEKGMTRGICSKRCLATVVARSRGRIFVPFAIKPVFLKEVVAVSRRLSKDEQKKEYLRLRILARQRGRLSGFEGSNRRILLPVQARVSVGFAGQRPSTKDPMGVRLQEAFLDWEVDRKKREQENKHKHWAGA